jgi:hypothetical protein
MREISKAFSKANPETYLVGCNREGGLPDIVSFIAGCILSRQSDAEIRHGIGVGLGI